MGPRGAQNGFRINSLALWIGQVEWEPAQLVLVFGPVLHCLIFASVLAPFAAGASAPNAPVILSNSALISSHSSCL